MCLHVLKVSVRGGRLSSDIKTRELLGLQHMLMTPITSHLSISLPKQVFLFDLYDCLPSLRVK